MLVSNFAREVATQGLRTATTAAPAKAMSLGLGADALQMAVKDLSQLRQLGGDELARATREIPANLQLGAVALELHGSPAVRHLATALFKDADQFIASGRTDGVISHAAKGYGTLMSAVAARGLRA
ncbi:MAG: hypothetical protein JWM25_1325 [Thermoleophilia bacterium]|nr:hypothetical protein [Thermoleophilia bacterium]